MKVLVTQYVRPRGRRKLATTNLPDDLFPQYERMIEADCRFEAEVLSTGKVSVTISNDDEDLDICVVHNGPMVQEAMATMLRRFQREASHDDH